MKRFILGIIIAAGILVATAVQGASVYPTVEYKSTALTGPVRLLVGASTDSTYFQQFVGGTWTTRASWKNGAHAGGLSTANTWTGKQIFKQIETQADSSYTLGPGATNGSWRITTSGGNLLVQKRESGTWVTKFTHTATGVTATEAELNRSDITTEGTVEASKNVTADANKDITGARQITSTFATSSNTLNTTAYPLLGSVTASSATITGGNARGVRGLATLSGTVTGGAYIMGLQGKLAITGRQNHADSRLAGAFAQLDISAATCSTGAGQLSGLWVDAGASASSDMVTYKGGGQFNLLRLTNTTAASSNALIYGYADADYLFDLGGPGGNADWFTTSGDATNDGGAFKALVNGQVRYVNLGTSAGNLVGRTDSTFTSYGSAASKTVGLKLSTYNNWTAGLRASRFDFGGDTSLAAGAWRIRQTGDTLFVRRGTSGSFVTRATFQPGTTLNEFRMQHQEGASANQRGAFTLRNPVITEEPTLLLFGTSTTGVPGTAIAYIGGGSSAANAVTQIALYTAGNTKTTTGTLRMTVDSTGVTPTVLTTPDLNLTGTAGHSSGAGVALCLTDTISFRMSGDSVFVGTVPAGAIITSVIAQVDTAFNAGTTNVVTCGTIGTGKEAYIGEGSLNEASETAQLVRGSATLTAPLNDPAPLWLYYTQTGDAATAGQVRVSLTFIKP